MAYGTPRTPAEILPYYTDIRRGRPPTDEQLADLTAPLRRNRRNLAAGRAHRGAARRAASRARRASPTGEYHVALGLKHAAAVDRGRRSTSSPPAAFRRARRPGPGAALLGAVGRPVPRPADRRRRGSTASTCRRHRELGHRTGLRRLPRRRRAHAAAPAARPDTRCCSPPTRCPSGSSRPAIRIPTELRPPRTPSRRRCGSSTDWGDRRGRAPGARPSRGWTRHPEVIDELAADRHTSTGVLVVRRADSSPTTSRCSTTSTSRPARAPPSRAGLRPHRVRQRRSGRDGGSGRAHRRRRVSSDRRIARRRGRDHRPRRRTRGCSAPGAHVELFEAGSRLGGMIRTSPFAGLPAIDEGADAFLARVPHGPSSSPAPWRSATR